jgi:DNA phosphorothioation-dependent restriction protein DptG
METNDFFNFVHQGFRTAVGATASIVETLQDPQKREQTLSEINEQWQKKSDTWAKKGEVTEEEARRMIEKFFHQQEQNRESRITKSVGENQEDISAGSFSQANSAQEIQELSATIVSLREQLEKANQSAQ